MSVPDEFSIPPSGAAGDSASRRRGRVGLRSSRCAYHEEREAAAFCRGCDQSFCRECVTEHGDAMYCQRCLAARGVARSHPNAGAAALVVRCALALAGFCLIVALAALFLSTAVSHRAQRLPGIAGQIHGQ